MKRIHLFGALVSVLVVTALLVVSLPAIVLADPTPMVTWGDVTLDGAPAPYGTAIEIFIGADTEPSGSDNVTTPGQYGAMVVWGDSSRYGEALTYKVNGYVATTDKVSLTCDGIDTPVFGLCNQVVNLAAVSGPTPTEITIDIKPGSFPNSIKVNSKGVLPVAILGTPDFDVMTVDPVTMLLSWDGISFVPGVSPLRWAWKDVNRDGFMDIGLKYSMDDLMTYTVTNEPPGDLIMTLMGNLMEEYGGTPIAGEDMVRIINKGYDGL